MRASLAPMLVLAIGCGSSTPDYSWGGPLVRVEGRVVAPDGAPLAQARVQLVSGQTAEIARSAIGSTTTDARGRFAFDDVRRESVNHVVIAALGSVRTYFAGPRQRGSAVEHLGDLPFAPDRALAIRAHCPRALARDRDGNAAIWVKLEWMGRNVIDVQLLPTDVESTDDIRIEQSLVPGFDQREREVPTAARAFERTVRAPVGENRVEARGGCGERSETVTVPAEGEVSALVLDFE